MKKVLYLIPNLAHGGAEKVLVNLANNMDKTKFDVTVQTLFDVGVNRQYLNSDVKYIGGFKRMPRGNTYVMKLFSPEKLFKYFIRDNYDIIVSYLEGPTARIVSGCTNPNTKLVSWIHIEQHTKELASKSFRSYKEALDCYSKFDRTVCVSDTVKDDFESIFDTKKSVEVLYNTNESEKIKKLSDEKVDDVNFSKDIINIISVAKIVPSKGYDRLMKIHKKLIEENIKNHIYILGIGEEKEKYEKYLTENNLILNRLFTQNVFFDMIDTNDNTTYGTVIQRFVNDYENKDNGALISEVYRFMSKSYRNEYFYQNTLLNKLLLGKHSINTTTALTQIPISKSKADFILINGKAVVYEIKTELDTFERLDTQLRDYFKAFNHVCVVTSDSQYDRAASLLQNTPVGIYALTPQNTISSKLRKEPQEDNSRLDYTAIFKVLHKKEYENILLQYFGELPVASQAFYYGECLKHFSQIPILEAYTMALKQLKKRNRIEISEFEKIPYELKSLIYFSRPSTSDWHAINVFLNQKYGG